MIDFHSHILPDIDDGSKDVAQSTELLKTLTNQGITTVAATPHFYANDESVAEFLDRRAASYKALSQQLFEGAPKIILGAEVRYYQGIARMTELKRLCIEKSRLLLLEMPMSRWTEYTIKELIDLSSCGDLTVVLAHIERYLKFQNKNVWNRLLKSDILMQANATFFTDFSTRRKAINLLKSNFIHFLGSDCHDMDKRPPHIGKAQEIIKKKIGEDFLSNMTEYGYSLFS